MTIKKKFSLVIISLLIFARISCCSENSTAIPPLSRSTFGLAPNAPHEQYCSHLHKLASILIDQDRLYFIQKQICEYDAEIYNAQDIKKSLTIAHLNSALQHINDPDEILPIKNLLAQCESPCIKTVSANLPCSSNLPWAIYPWSTVAWATLSTHMELIKNVLTTVEPTCEHKLLGQQFSSNPDETIKYVGHLLMATIQESNASKLNGKLCNAKFKLSGELDISLQDFSIHSLRHYISTGQTLVDLENEIINYACNHTSNSTISCPAEVEQLITTKNKQACELYSHQRPIIVALYQTVMSELHNCITTAPKHLKRNLFQFTSIDKDKIPPTLVFNQYPEFRWIAKSISKEASTQTESHEKPKSKPFKIPKQPHHQHVTPKSKKKATKVTKATKATSKTLSTSSSKAVQAVIMDTPTPSAQEQLNTQAPQLNKQNTLIHNDKSDSLESLIPATVPKPLTEKAVTHTKLLKHIKPTKVPLKTVPPEQPVAPQNITTTEAHTCTTSSNIAELPLAWVNDMPYILEQTTINETESLVTIHDVSNQLIIHLFANQAKNRLNHHIPIKYYPEGSIKEWFEDSRQALIHQGYFNVGDKHYTSNINGLIHAIQIHRFSIFVDKYVHTMGFCYRTPSKKTAEQLDICVAIPGEVEYLNIKGCDGQPLRKLCAMVYIIDANNGFCYHRNITHCKTQDSLAKLYTGNFWVDEFPPSA